MYALLCGIVATAITAIIILICAIYNDWPRWGPSALFIVALITPVIVDIGCLTVVSRSWNKLKYMWDTKHRDWHGP